MTMYGNPPDPVGSVSVEYQVPFTPNVLPRSHSGILVNELVGPAPANGLFQAGAGVTDLSEGPNRALPPNQCHVLVAGRTTAPLVYVVSHSNDLTRRISVFDNADRPFDAPFDVLYWQRMIGGGGGEQGYGNSLFGNMQVPLGGITVVMPGPMAQPAAVLQQTGMFLGFPPGGPSVSVGDNPAFGVSRLGAGDYRVRTTLNQQADFFETYVLPIVRFASPGGIVVVEREVGAPPIADQSVRVRIFSEAGVLFDPDGFDLLYFAHLIAGGGPHQPTFLELAGSCQVNVVMGVATVAQSSGILLNENVFVGDSPLFGVSRLGPGSYNIRLGFNRQIPGDQGFVWVQPRATVLAIGNVNHVNDQIKHVFIANIVAGVFTPLDDVGFDVLFFKRTTT